MTSVPNCLRSSLLFAVLFCALVPPGQAAGSDAESLTPPPPPTPRVNGPGIFGVTPGAPFLYSIPATGERPLSYSASGLPEGLSLDPATGRITGSLSAKGTHEVVLRASNSLGVSEKKFRIVCGDTIALTPPMGWNSWNCWAHAVDQDKVLRSAKALVASGLARHGWTYINIDDTWQGSRKEAGGALQPNERFPDMKALCEAIHGMGLKAGIYSSPWITTYGGYPGDTADNAEGSWENLGPYPAYTKGQHLGKYSFAEKDARQFAAWGFDYLKYDWNPNDVEHTRLMGEALRATGRDIVYSLSNAAPFQHIDELSRYANCWRTTGDIWDTWDQPGTYQHSVSEIGFNQDRWTSKGRPGHWNDPDMLVLGWVGWGPQLHSTRLSHAEQYSHFTLWCMLSAPLLIGCDLERLDAFTLGLLSNDEVIAVNQDSLGKQASRIGTQGPIDIYTKELEDGATAVAFFNRGDAAHKTDAKLDRLGLGGKREVRDLWRQKNLGVFETDFSVVVEPHNVLLVKVCPAR